MAPSLATITPPATTQDPTPSPIQTHAALTTPFIYPPHCDVIRDVAPWIVWSSSTTATVTLLVLDPARPEVSSCQPPGWDQLDTGERFAFSAAVCPSGWDARRLDTAEEESGATATTAYCCRRYHTSHPAMAGVPCFCRSKKLTADY